MSRCITCKVIGTPGFYFVEVVAFKKMTCPQSYRIAPNLTETQPCLPFELSLSVFFC